MREVCEEIAQIMWTTSGTSLQSTLSPKTTQSELLTVSQLTNSWGNQLQSVLAHTEGSGTKPSQDVILLFTIICLASPYVSLLDLGGYLGGKEESIENNLQGDESGNTQEKGIASQQF